MADRAAVDNVMAAVMVMVIRLQLLRAKEIMAEMVLQILVCPVGAAVAPAIREAMAQRTAAMAV